MGVCGDLGVGRLGPFACGRVGDADEDHVPVGAGPAVPLAVARDPLLLRAGGDVAVDEGVGHPAAAGPAAVLMENDVAAGRACGERVRPARRPTAWCRPVGVTEKFSAARQKVVVALLLRAGWRRSGRCQ